MPPPRPPRSGGEFQCGDVVERREAGHQQPHQRDGVVSGGVEQVAEVPTKLRHEHATYLVPDSQPLLEHRDFDVAAQDVAGVGCGDARQVSALEEGKPLIHGAGQRAQHPPRAVE